MTKRILITGSRTWDDDYVTIEDAILAEAWANNGDAVVVHGGAKGADTLAHKAALLLSLPEEVHLPDWKYNGRAACILRNQRMVNLGADVCLAFIRNNSKGATDCARRAEEAGIPVRYFRREA